MFCYNVVMLEHKLPQTEQAKSRRKAATLLLAATVSLGAANHKAVTNTLSSAVNTSGSGETPALDTPFKIRGPQDTPDNIAVHSGVEGSQKRMDFENSIKQQLGENGPQPKEIIMVPHKYVEYVNQQETSQK